MDRQEKRVDVLIQQYQLLEARRDSFGRQFMQIIGFFIALFALLLGLFGKEQASVLAAVLAVSGIVLMVIAFLAYRLGARQNDCEKELANIENMLAEELDSKVAKFPQGAKRVGARAGIVATLVLGGAALLLIAFRMWLTS